MDNTKITILMRGGLIQEISSNFQNAEVMLLDVDELADNGKTEKQIEELISNNTHKFDILF